MTHRAPDPAAADEVLKPAPAPAPRRSLPARMFAEKYLPHWGALAITLLYIAFYAIVGGAAVPQPISLGWTGTVATWFGYLIQQSRKAKDPEK